MKKIFYTAFLILLIGCSSKSGVYWCGDHPCINNKEKEAYFKKNMIVEFKEKEKGTPEEESAIKKIIEQAKINEKERIKNEKILLKQAKIDEKNRLKEEREFKKREKAESENIKKQDVINQDEKIVNQEQAELIQEIEEEENILSKKNNDSKSLSNYQQGSLEKNIVSNQFPKPTSFNQIVKRIREKNSVSDYPDINNTPN